MDDARSIFVEGYIVHGRLILGTLIPVVSGTVHVADEDVLVCIEDVTGVSELVGHAELSLTGTFHL